MTDELITPQQAEDKQPTCADRIDEQYESTMDDLRKLWSAYCQEECPECEGTGFIESDTLISADDGDTLNEECKLCDGTGELSEDSYSSDIGTMFEYGLSFDYVGHHDGRPGYFRYQLSWGGPSDEFRIYAERISEWQWSVWKVEYWFMDWFDGAHKVLTGDDLRFIEELFEGLFVSSGTASSAHKDTMEGY
jgi:hypothetical protein